jgi:hypothetical protein
MAERVLCTVRDGEFACSRCGHPLYPGVGRVCPGPRPGLGDMVAAGLSAVGITPERVSAVIGGPCGCEERKEALNDWGRDHLGIG